LRARDFIRAATRYAARDLRQDLAAGAALAAVAISSQLGTAHLTPHKFSLNSSNFARNRKSVSPLHGLETVRGGEAFERLGIACRASGPFLSQRGRSG
jgi:hypothetical protein